MATRKVVLRGTFSSVNIFHDPQEVGQCQILTLMPNNATRLQYGFEGQNTYATWLRVAVCNDLIVSHFIFKNSLCNALRVWQKTLGVQKFWSRSYKAWESTNKFGTATMTVFVSTATTRECGWSLPAKFPSACVRTSPIRTVKSTFLSL